MVQNQRLIDRHDARRDEFLSAASALAAEQGIEALTMKALADHLGCAVGTAYSYFPSKGALVAAVQAAAIGRLADAYGRAAPGLEPWIDPLSDADRTLARLVAFGRFIVAAEQAMPHDFHLQQQLLGSPVTMAPAEAETVVPVAFELLARPQELIVAAVEAGALAPLSDVGATFERGVTWVAAVNGVLSLSSIQVPARGLFDTAAMADRLSLDLLRAWGADDAALARAADAVPIDHIHELLAAVGGTTEPEPPL